MYLCIHEILTCIYIFRYVGAPLSANITQLGVQNKSWEETEEK